MSALVARLKSTQIHLDEVFHAALPGMLVIGSMAVVLAGLTALHSIGVL